MNIRRYTFITFFIFCFLNVTNAFSMQNFGNNKTNTSGPVIATIPKSGTNFLMKLSEVLKVPVTVCHYALNFENSHGLSRNVEDFQGNTVVEIRDLRDIMCSSVFWIDKLIADYIKKADLDEIKRQNYMNLLNASFEEKLTRTIKKEGPFYMPQMNFTKHSAELAVQLIKNGNKVFVIHFEDIIGEESGGRLSNKERSILISDMYLFLGYKRSPQQVENAIKTIFGKSNTYNPIKCKVGRWKNHFSQDHIMLFESMWNDLNIALGYPSIME